MRVEYLVSTRIVSLWKVVEFKYKDAQNAYEAG